MSESLWTKVDRYFEGKLLPEISYLRQALAANTSAELPAIDVSPLQGGFLSLLIKIQGARRVLEIGTLGGYSTLWIAQALPPGGTITTLELNPKHAEVAQRNFASAGFSERIQLLVGPALESLDRLVAEKTEPYDFVFIDADKVNSAAYFERALALCRSGTVIIADNVVRKGEVISSDSEDLNVQGTRRLIDLVSEDSRVEASALQTVGMKGYDGFVVIRVR